MREYITIKVYDTQSETDMGDVVATTKDVSTHAEIRQLSGEQVIRMGMDIHDNVYRIKCRKEFDVRPMEISSPYGTLEVINYREEQLHYWIITAKQI